MTIFISNFALFEEQAKQETRDVTFAGHPEIPDDSYGLLEYYCPDPACDCQMVMLGIVSRRLQRQVANIVYSFNPAHLEPNEPNPELGMAPQAPYAHALLDWFTMHLAEDPAYEKRLRSHYQQVKEAAGDPSHPAHAKYLAWEASLSEDNSRTGGESEAPHKNRRKPAAGQGSLLVPKVMQARYEEIVTATDRFAQAHLNVEYRELCRNMTAALARKRPSPLASGKASVWAAAVIYALGQVNFLFDKSQEPYVSADELCAEFGISKSTAGNKARRIREILDIYTLDPRWSLPSRLSENPMAWMISVDGLIVDARTAPREIQEEALRKGLIPYIP